MSFLAIWRLAQGVPRGAWIALAVALALLALARWHGRAVDRAFTSGVQQQAAADRAAVLAATAAATRAAQDRNAALGRAQAAISRESDDELGKARTAVVRRRDDLRLRWAAARTAAGGGNAIAAAALPGAATVALDTACPAAGWVAFDTAAAAAAAADEATAKDDAWIAWVTAQRDAWPNE